MWASAMRVWQPLPSGASRVVWRATSNISSCEPPHFFVQSIWKLASATWCQRSRLRASANGGGVLSAFLKSEGADQKVGPGCRVGGVQFSSPMEVGFGFLKALEKQVPSLVLHALGLSRAARFPSPLQAVCGAEQRGRRRIRIRLDHLVDPHWAAREVGQRPAEELAIVPIASPINGLERLLPAVLLELAAQASRFLVAERLVEEWRLDGGRGLAPQLIQEAHDSTLRQRVGGAQAGAFRSPS